MKAYLNCNNVLTDDLLRGLVAYEAFPERFAGTLGAITDGNPSMCYITQTTPNDAFLRYDMNNTFNVREVQYTYRPDRKYRWTLSLYLKGVR